MTLLSLPVEDEKIPDGIALSVVVDRASLATALAQVVSVVPSKDLIPVLKNFHLRVTGNDLRISGSDSILSAVTHVDTMITHTEGEAVFQASRLLSLVREADGSMLTIKVKSKNEKMAAEVKSEKAQWVFPLMSPKGYPDFSEQEKIGTASVQRVPFLEALSQVRKAVAVDTMRPYFMMVDLQKGKVRASDSNRFQQVKFSFPFDCQIPSRGLPELINRLTNCEDEEIEVGTTEQALLFRIGSVLFILQKVSAKFPDVDAILLKPAELNDQILRVNRDELLSAVRRARITADEETSAVVLSLNNGSASIECKDRKGGVSVESVEADWKYPPRHVAFNHQHLTDMLTSIKAEECVFKLGKDLKSKPTPLYLEDGSGFQAVLTQIRIDWL